jgi:hypothetical protein
MDSFRELATATPATVATHRATATDATQPPVATVAPVAVAVAKNLPVASPNGPSNEMFMGAAGDTVAELCHAPDVMRTSNFPA